jgi:hypothetical protein
MIPFRSIRSKYEFEKKENYLFFQIFVSVVSLQVKSVHSVKVTFMIVVEFCLTVKTAIS